MLFNEDAEKAAHFIQLADQVDTPLLFMQNTTGYIVGTDYEQRGIVKAGAKMINAVANAGVPKLTLMMGGSYGAGNYGMCGRSFEPRFIFAWPNYKTAVMGPKQLAGVMEIVARGKAARAGIEVDEEQLAADEEGRRGADRVRVGRVHLLRGALGRRHDRPQGHAHGARDRALGRPQQRGRRLAPLRRLPDVSRPG